MPKWRSSLRVAVLSLLAFSACVKSGPRGMGQNLGGARFSLVSPASSSKLGDCVPVTLQLAAPAATAQSYTGALTAANGDRIESVFSDASCGIPMSSMNIPAGATSLLFYVPSVFLGKAVVSATTASEEATMEMTVAGHAPAGFAVYYSGAVGACVPLRIGPVDAKGRPTTFPSATTAQITVAAGSVRAYSDSQCATPSTSVPFAASQPFAALYVKNTVYEIGRLTFAAGFSSTVNVVLAPSPVEQLSITGPATGSPTVCTGPFEMSLRNLAGDSVAAPTALSISPRASLNGVTFFSDAACSLAANTSIASGAMTSSFYVRAPAAGNVTLFASETIGGIPTINPKPVVFQ